jgi:DNA-binding MarR family transcriptional regulator
MTLDSESKNTVLRLWLLLHRVRDMLFLCEDSLFAKYGLTTEQLGLLGAVKTLGGSPRPTDLAQRLERSPNSISMLVDRMVKAGLVRRTRDRKDRRTVFVSATSKGEKAVGLALPAG